MPNFFKALAKVGEEVFTETPFREAVSKGVKYLSPAEKTPINFEPLLETLKQKGRKRFLKTAVAGAAGAGAIFGQPSTAEGIPLEEPIRIAYKAALREIETSSAVKQPLFHLAGVGKGAERLLKRGMREVPSHTAELVKPAGLYFSFTPKTLLEHKYLEKGSLTRKTVDNIVRGILNTQKVATITVQELSKAYSTFIKEITGLKHIGLDELGDPKLMDKWTSLWRSRVDALIVTNLPTPKKGVEVIALNPSKVKLFWRDMKWPLSIGATVGGLTLMGGQGKEAEAMPVGEITKLTKNLLERTVSSSTAKRLIGAKVRGQVIKDVLKSRGNWRYLVFDNDEVLPITKDYLQALTRAVGSKQYMKKLVTKSPKGQLAQALKSLEIREAGRGPETTSLYRKTHRAFLETVKDLESTLTPETIWVKSTLTHETLQLPKPYAEILEKEGRVKILREQLPKRVKGGTP